MRLDLYSSAHAIRDKFPGLWNAANKINERLFLLRYGRKLRNAIQSIENSHTKNRYKYANVEDIDAMVTFFQKQPADSFKYFKPHAFDRQSIKSLISNRSFLTFVIYDDNAIVGYFFSVHSLWVKHISAKW